VLITRQGIVNRQGVDGIRLIGRNTQGVKLINLEKNDSVMDVARVVNEDAEPLPITTTEDGEGQEMVPSDALEEELGIEDGDEDLDADEFDDASIDEILDELTDEDES